MVSVSRGFIDKDNYMKSCIRAGDFLSKKHFKSHYAGARERNVCLVSVNCVVESVTLSFKTQAHLLLLPFGA